MHVVYFVSNVFDGFVFFFQYILFFNLVVLILSLSVSALTVRGGSAVPEQGAAGLTAAPSAGRMKTHLQQQ